MLSHAISKLRRRNYKVSFCLFPLKVWREHFPKRDIQTNLCDENVKVVQSSSLVCRWETWGVSLTWRWACWSVLPGKTEQRRKLFCCIVIVVIFMGLGGAERLGGAGGFILNHRARKVTKSGPVFMWGSWPLYTPLVWVTTVTFLSPSQLEKYNIIFCILSIPRNFFIS